MSNPVRRRKGGSSSSISISTSIPTPIIILSSIILIPYFLSLIHLSPFSILLSFPLIILIWVLSIPISLLFVAYLADSKTCSNPSISTWTSDSHLDPIHLPSRSFSQLRPESFRTQMHPGSASVSQSVDHLISLILRDFVQKWHLPLLYGNGDANGNVASLTPDSTGSSTFQPHHLFSLATEKSIRHALTSGIEIAAQLDLPSFSIGRILPTITNHLERFRIAEMELEQSGGPDKSGFGPLGSKKEATGSGGGRKAALSTTGSSEEVDLFLAAKYQSSGTKLHPAVSNVSSPDSRPSELEHLRKLATRALNHVLPPEERQSRAVFVTVREVVACTVLMAVVDQLSDPDFWNGLLDQKTGAAMQEQQLVQQLRQALDRRGSSDSPSSTSATLPNSSALGSLAGFALSSATGAPPNTSDTRTKKPQHSFDAFLKSIEEIDSILEARRSRNDVSLQIRKTKSALASMPNDSTEKKSGLIRYLERLHVALAAAERRVEELSTGHKQVVKNDFALPTSPSRSNSSSSQTTLEQILHNTSTLSYWMEHMDRRKRSELIQFWLAVESFKDPLESVESESEDIESSSLGGMNPDPATIQTLKDDLRLFTEVYFPSKSLNIKSAYVAEAETFIQSNSTPSPREVQKARESVLKAQRQVFKEMLEDDWPSFKSGDLFFKAQDELDRENISMRNAGGSIHSRVSSISEVAPSTSNTGFFSTAASRTDHTFQASRNGRKTPSVLSVDQSFSSETPTPSGMPTPSLARSSSGHADLFGQEPASLTEPGARSFLSSSSRATAKPLFEENEAKSKVNSSLVSPSINENFHFLVGSGKGSRKGADGRAPLFDNPLFEDGEEEEETGFTNSSSSGSRGKDSELVKVEVEMMDAVTSILNHDESRKKVEKSKGNSGSLPGAVPKLGKSTAARDLRPAFKKSGASDALKDSKGLFGEDLAVRGEAEDSDGSVVEMKEQLLSSSSEEESGIALPVDRAEKAFTPETLDLSAEISRLSAKLEKLFPQEELLEALMRKAELTGARDKELRLLTKSKSAVRREIKELEWQIESFKKQYEEQKLGVGKTSVRVRNSTVGHDPDGKEFTIYLIEVTQRSTSGSETAPSSGWIVGRRYSEFFSLHQRLKERFPEVQSLESKFPPRRFVSLGSAPFVDSRRISLDKYLQLIAEIPRVIESLELSLFLSRSQATSSLVNGSADYAFESSNDKSTSNQGTKSSTSQETAYPGQLLVKTFFKGMNGVAVGLDGLIFGQSMFDVVHQRLLAQSRTASASDAIDVGQTMQGASLAEVKEAAAAGTTYFTAPICDLVSELFELKRENNWLRRQAIVIILQQLLGGTIERKLRETVSNALSPVSLLSYIASLQNILWPNGQLKEPSKPRTPKEKAELRESANRKLSTFIPDVASNFIGRQNARQGARRLFSVVQNRRLNRHLIYTILDQVFDESFPPLDEDSFS